MKKVRDPATMTAGQINRELDLIDETISKLTDAFIAAGRGEETSSQTAKLKDPLANAFNAQSSRRIELRLEIEHRWGPAAPSRLPGRGFGPRRKSGT